MKHFDKNKKCKEEYSGKDMKQLKARVTESRNLKRRKNTMSDKTSNETLLKCKVCNIKCQVNTIKKHFAKNPKCHNAYSEEDLKTINEKCLKFQKAKKSRKSKERYNKTKNENNKTSSSEVNINSYSL